MDPKSAAENLQVIRTLMERSALYRRALAPVMLAAGVLGLAGGFIGNQLHLDSFRAFVIFWFTIAGLVIGIALLIARRQALSSQEPFWTPPTRQVVRAMTPPLVAGFLMVFSPIVQGFHPLGEANLVGVWLVFYGCALHSAGLFVSRGVRLLGWSFIVASVVIEYMRYTGPNSSKQWEVDGTPPLFWQPHAMMGLTFGGLHLLASLYLYVTEKRKNAQ
jgi:hypothetical protein